MASIARLVSSFDTKSKEFEWLVHDLMVDNNDVPFDSNEVDTVQNVFVKSVNSRINQGGCDFLPILNEILSTCSKDTFSKYGLFWIVNVTKVLENVHTSANNLTLACKVLGLLIEQCKKIPELHKQISMQHVKQLVNILSELQANAKSGAVYYLLAVLLYHYPEVCERFQKIIMKMILLQIDSTQERLVNASAKCYVLLSKATERSFKPPPSKFLYTATTYNEALLCNSLYTIIDELFSGLLELESVDIWDQLELPSISNRDTIQYYNAQKQRFTNLCIYLSSMLRGYEARNSVQPYDILAVLCRGLAITPLNVKDKTSLRKQMLYYILPKLHISLFTILDALINGFAQELIPYGSTILQLFQQTLQWTSIVSENEMTFSDSRSFKNIRIHIYKCLCSWLINTSTLSGIETIANECVTFILKDITPERNCILLMQQKTQHLSKRAIKRFKHSQYENSTTLNNQDSSRNGHLNADLCKQALIVLQNILFSGSVLLKQSFYKNVQNIVFPLLYNLYLGSTEQNFYKDHNVCRLELLRLLRALQMNPHITLAFPTQYCLDISHMATQDVDINIVQEAKLLSTVLEKIIHPIAPTLQLPRQQDLGNESVSENKAEEIITITTNRLDKRNRSEEELFEDADAISIHKRSKIVTIQCEKSQNESNIELIEEDNNIDAIQPQTETNSIEEETDITLQEQDETQSKEQSELNMDTNSNTAESNKECQLDASFNINEKNQEQHEELEEMKSCKKDKEVKENRRIDEKIQKSQHDIWETLDNDVIECIKSFHDEVKSTD